MSEVQETQELFKEANDISLEKIDEDEESNVGFESGPHQNF